MAPSWPRSLGKVPGRWRVSCPWPVLTVLPGVWGGAPPRGFLQLCQQEPWQVGAGGTAVAPRRLREPGVARVHTGGSVAVTALDRAPVSFGLGGPAASWFSLLVQRLLLLLGGTGPGGGGELCLQPWVPSSPFKDSGNPVPLLLWVRAPSSLGELQAGPSPPLGASRPCPRGAGTAARRPFQLPSP